MLRPALRCLTLALCALFLGAAGCTAPVPPDLLGTWEEDGSQRGALTFSEDGRFALDLGRADEPVEVGTYRVEGEDVVVELGEVTTRLTFRDGRLVQDDGTVYSRRAE